MPMLAVRSQGKYTEADPLYVRVVEIREGALGADHPDLAISLGTRGQLLKAQVCVFIPYVDCEVSAGGPQNIFHFVFVLLPHLVHLRFWPFRILKREGFSTSLPSHCTHDQISLQRKLSSESLSVRIEPRTLLLVG